VALHLGRLAPTFLSVRPRKRCCQYMLRAGCIRLSETIIKHSATFHILPMKAKHRDPFRIKGEKRTLSFPRNFSLQAA
jgi:hypothetical protein